MRTRIAVSVIVLSLIVAFGFAQSPSAEIRGFVTDEAGTVLAGVLVTLTGAEQRSTATDSNGEFVFRNLRAGNYELQFQLAGFQTASSKLTVSTRVERLTIKMSVGALTESVSVQSQTDNLRVAEQALGDASGTMRSGTGGGRGAGTGSGIGVGGGSGGGAYQRGAGVRRRRRPYPAGTTRTSIPKPTITSTRIRFAAYRPSRSRRSRSMSTPLATRTCGDSSITATFRRRTRCGSKRWSTISATTIRSRRRCAVLGHDRSCRLPVEYRSTGWCVGLKGREIRQRRTTAAIWSS